MVRTPPPPDIYSGLKSLFWIPAIDVRDAPQIRAQQLRSVGHLVPVMLMGNLLNCAVMMIAFQGAEQGQWLAYWSFLLILACGLIELGHTRQRSAYQRVERSAKAVDGFARTASIMGFLWAMAPIIVFPVSDAMGQMVLGIVLASMMFGGAFSLARIPEAAMAFITPVVVGAVIGLQLTPSIRESVLAILMTVYFIMLIICIRANYAQYIGLIVGQGAVAQQGQLIGLLLRDFEENASDWLWQTNDKGVLQELPLNLAGHKSQYNVMESGAELAALFIKDENQGALRVNLTRRTTFKDLLLQVEVGHARRWWMLTGKPLYEQGDFVGFRGVAADVTAAKDSEDRIAYMAHYDGLTGLPNRASMQERLEKDVRRPVHGETERAFLLLDLDNFKWVNDTLGHPAGDELLKRVSDRILAVIEPQDMAARLGGDEFAIVIERARAKGGITPVVAELSDRLGRPYELNGSTARCSASIGVRRVDRTVRESRILMKHADLALYHAKQLGKARWVYFTEELELRARRRREIEANLQRALEENELRVFFQPQVDATTHEIVGAEALLRWQHPERGLIYPTEFIEAAEDCGVITRLGDWVLRAALARARHLPDHIRISVNISPLQIHSANLFSTIVNALAANGIDPARLELEITESVLLTDSDFTLDRLHKLKSLGLRIALDDFGTGYSSLSYLRKFPFDKIKLDKSFISDIETNSEARAITRATLQLAKSLGLSCTAEGVETEMQSAFLRDEGCDELQGFLISRAHPAERLIEMMGLSPPTSEPLDQVESTAQIKTAI